MNLFELTRALVDIESTTNHEKNVGDCLFAHLSALTTRYNGNVERIAAEPNRDNIFVSWGEPVVTLSTHMDTVPPFFGSREDDDFIWGRGSCDAKGIIAAMIAAAEKLLAAGTRNLGLHFVVGEERNSAGARAAAATPRGSRFLINGEPTKNRLALGSKGALLGDSTLNIGTIDGGRAPNVVADQADAELMFRTIGDPAGIREAVSAGVAGRAEAREVFYTPALQLAKLDGLPTTVVAFTTDIPSFEGTWGEPFLIGPGSIHVAHTAEERISKRELSEAVDIYARMAGQLLATGRSGA